MRNEVQDIIARKESKGDEFRNVRAGVVTTVFFPLCVRDAGVVYRIHRLTENSDSASLFGGESMKLCRGWSESLCHLCEPGAVLRIIYLFSIC